MVRWINYLQERLPFQLSVPLVVGLSFSGLFVNGGHFLWVPFIFSILGVLLFFMTEQLIEEFNSYEKDRVAHPEKPLPRGLFTRLEFETAINRLLATMFVYGLVIWAFFTTVAATSYLLVAIYLYHIYKEFYIEDWLRYRPLTRQIVHVVVMIPVVVFTIAIARPENATYYTSISYAITVAGAFFVYDICRGLKPSEHPISMTDVQFYGYRKTFFFAACGLIVSAFFASGVEMTAFLWPVELAVFISMSLLFFDSNRYKFAEYSALLSLYIHAWSGVIQLF
jgi:hypothetical protein